MTTLSLARIVIAAAALTGLAGCDTLRESFGLNKRAPDEFEVVTKAPLTLPPEFALRPPDPGAPRPQEEQPRQSAQAALTGRSGDLPLVEPVRGDARSAGETALLRQAGAADAPANIRQVINREYSQLAERDRSFTDRLIFWQQQAPPGTVIDAQKEAQRLRQNAATGQPVTTGETPIIERRKRAILEGIF